MKIKFYGILLGIISLQAEKIDDQKNDTSVQKEVTDGLTWEGI